MKTVLITGASSGIGYELAKVYAENNNNLILVARRKDRLEKLKKEILEKNNSKINVLILEKDLGKANASFELYQEVKKHNIDVDVLINNAGIGIHGEFSKILWADMYKNNSLINLNIRTVVELTKLYLDDFLQKNKGEILNVASIASFFPGPIMATYYASKAFVFSFTEAIREEVAYSNIKIGTLCPGPTATEFEKSPNMEKSTMFAKLKIMTAKKVAQITYRDFEKGKNIIIPGTLNKITVFIARFLPRKTITKIAKRMQEKK
ncbi:SDR family NAD(P)-dependent oxidoreductase [Leptotrichia sp. HSP-536]|uniref:SDR family NAD(P)-dependent oxidoreductase n=1 Tax=Leptotrichia alba TaxID=3239304 RepID=A0AB39V3A9_9FUSO